MKPNKNEDEEDFNTEDNQDVDNQGDQNDEGADSSNDGDSGIDESKLRKMGWVPKEEFKGPEANWMDAETFNRKRGDDATLRRELREAKQVIQEFSEFNKTREERAYKRALADIKAKKLAAVEDGDSEAYRRIEIEEQELYEDNKPPERKQQKAVIPEEVEDWIASNPWFDNDPDLRIAATAYHGNLGKTNPNLSLSENLKQTGEYIKKIFPEKFAGSSRRAASVEGNRFNSIKTNSTKKKTAADLPDEAKDAGRKFVRQGLYKTMDEYAKDYFEE